MTTLEKILNITEINAIKKLEEENERCYKACEGCCSEVEEDKCNCNDALIINAIKKIKNHINDGWIPVEEQLPDDGKTVLCTDGDYVYLVEYDADWDTPFGDVDGIIAWQYLPEPYRPERNNEE